MKFMYSTAKEHEDHTKFLEKRFKRAKAVVGSRGFHCFIPIDENKISCKKVSNSETFQVFEVINKKKKIVKKV